MRKFLFSFFIFISFSCLGQKVGLVLSGGGAKGLAHVGVLKALEENGIPIDYIVGTSMGGVIGGTYAAGLSPYQIEEIVLSEEFLRSINGFPETGYNYYYHTEHPNPGFFELDLSLDSSFNVTLNSTVANDASLNFALTDRLAQANAISKGNFDSLFVPLRVIAAEIFTQTEVVLSRGILSDAIRATFTVPFIFNPIKVDGRYLFDGGVYNNFPVDVAEEEFNPDVIIGVNVSSKTFNKYPYGRDDFLINNSLLYLFLDKSDSTSVKNNGVYIEPNLERFTSFDFSKAKSMIDSGYFQTLRQLDQIKAILNKRVECEVVMERRNAFNNRNFQLEFSELSFSGFNTKQQKYISRIFGIHNASGPIYYRDMKKGYFSLMSEEYFDNVYPKIVHDSMSGKFLLHLSRRPQKNFQIDFGGVIATRNISNIYLGLNLYRFNRSLSHFYTGFQTGSFYKSFIARARIDYSFLNKFYLEPVFTINSWDYLQNEDLLKQQRTTVLTRTDRKTGIWLGWPISSKYKIALGIEGFTNRDRFSNEEVFVSTDTLDDLRLNGFKTGIEISSSTLNRKQYASAGSAFQFSALYFDVGERYFPGSTSLQQNQVQQTHQWFQLRLKVERYFNKGTYRVGYRADGIFSNQPPFSNYFGALINTPTYDPLIDSRTLVLPNFRSTNFVSLGLRNVFILKSKLDLRLEAYLFKPFSQWEEGFQQDAIERVTLTDIYWAASAGLVLHSPIGPIGLSTNYYDNKKNPFGILLHAGFLLFDSHSLD